jgi:hypothetical protein
LFNNGLTKDEKKKLCPKTWHLNSITDLLDLVTAAKDKTERELYPWTDSIQRIFRQVNRYASVGDLLIQHHPEYTSLLWGSFRFLLFVSHFHILQHESFPN